MRTSSELFDEVEEEPMLTDIPSNNAVSATTIEDNHLAIDELTKCAKLKDRFLDYYYANRTHFYSCAAQYRIVMQLEQVIGIAEKNPVVKSLL